jgi:hypothetical protein
MAVRRAVRFDELGLLAAGFALALGVAVVMPARLDALSSTKLAVVIAGLVFLVVIGWLSITRSAAVLVLGFVLLLAVRVEPAPSDAVFAILIATSYVLARPKPRVPAFIALPLAGFVVLTLVSMINVVDMHRAIKFEFITLYMIVLAVWLTWVFADAVLTRIAVKAYLAAAIISGILGPLALYGPLPGKQTFLYYGQRAEGLFKDPNVYSAFLVPAALILLEEVNSPRLLTWRRSRVIAAFGAVSIGIVVAYSRAAWLDFVVGIVTLVTVQASRHGGLRRAVRSVGLLVAAGIAGLTVLILSGSFSFFQSRSHLQQYDQQRFANQHNALADMTHHVFGYGPGQVEVILPIATHSYFARAAFEQGLLGVATLTIVLVGTALCAFVLCRRTTNVNGVGTAALLGAWLGQSANSLFIDTLHWRHLWVVAALIWSGYVSTSPPSEPVPTAAPTLRPLPRR